MTRWASTVTTAQWSLLSVLAVSLFWGWQTRREMVMSSIAQPLPTAWEVMYAITSDPYLWLYLLLPVFFFTASRQVLDFSGYATLLRSSSQARWLGLFMVRCATLAMLFTAAVVVAAAVSSLGLPRSPIAVSSSGSSASDVLATLATVGEPLPVLLSTQIVQLIAALVVGLALLAITYMWTDSIPVLFISAAGLWIGLVVSFAIGLNAVPGPLSVLFLHEAVSWVPWWTTPTIPLIALAALGGLVVLIERRQHILPATAVLLGRPTTVYALICAGATLAVAQGARGGVTNPWDVFTAVAWGTSPTGVSPAPYSLFMVLILGFVYLESMRLDQQIGARLPYVLIRRPSLTVWLSRVIGLAALRAMALLATVFIVTLAMGLTAMPRTTVAVEPLVLGPDVQMTLLEAIWQFGLNGLLQLMSYFLLLLIIVWWRGDAALALGVIAILAIFSLPGANAGGFIPVSLNSLGMVSEAMPTWRITTHLMVALGLLLAVMAWLLAASSRPGSERN